jgi:hypothetical protein
MRSERYVGRDGVSHPTGFCSSRDRAQEFLFAAFEDISRDLVRQLSCGVTTLSSPPRFGSSGSLFARKTLAFRRRQPHRFVAAWAIIAKGLDCIQLVGTGKFFCGCLGFFGGVEDFPIQFQSRPAEVIVPHGRLLHALPSAN